mgnify:CR=1 FL=1
MRWVYLDIGKFNGLAETMDEMIRYLGPEGTLVMPAFPFFKNMPKSKEFLKKDINEEVFEYDAKKTT